jgi:hypothetical protein
VRSGEAEDLAEVVDEEQARLDVMGVFHAVDGKGDGCGHGRWFCAPEGAATIEDITLS